MDNNNGLAEALQGISNIVKNDSWFRDTPHHWAIASLPLAYALACVEVLSNSSTKAGEIYKQIIEAWSHLGLKTLYDAFVSEVSDSELERVKEALIHPEKDSLPDPNKPFRDLEYLFSGLKINEDFLEDNVNHELSPEEEKAAEQYMKIVCLILEFVIEGFNRDSDKQNERYRVVPSEKAPWLICTVMIRTVFDSNNITLERLRYIYKVRKYKGKVIDFHNVLTEQPMSRWHRRIVASSKAVKLKLKNDRIFKEAARHWYNCRVVYSSINKYCDAPGNYHLDPKNINKQIRPCDDAVGYIRRLPRKEKLGP
jgi:hypothetical protein